jgi:low molecular weight protein-tyrosine phosphatase
MAEAVFRDLVRKADLSERVDVESAGTGDWHVGQRPHNGTLATLNAHHIDVGNKRARALSRSDLSEFDYVIAMDAENVADIQAMFGKRVPRLLEFVPQADTLDVPDPYYNGNFDRVYQLVQDGGLALLAMIRKQEGL